MVYYYTAVTFLGMYTERLLDWVFNFFVDACLFWFSFSSFFHSSNLNVLRKFSFTHSENRTASLRDWIKDVVHHDFSNEIWLIFIVSHVQWLCYQFIKRGRRKINETFMAIWSLTKSYYHIVLIPLMITILYQYVLF